MSGAALQVEEAARGDLGGLHRGSVAAEKEAGAMNLDPPSDVDDEVLTGPNGEIYPTKEELNTLRRVHGHTSWVLYTIW
jgi:proton-dependent oligopeptide transporter, POT family